MYSLIAAISVFITTTLAEYIATKNKLNIKDKIWQVILMVILFGIIGARAYHVIDFYPYYQANPILILNFRAGGLGIYGGLIGGLIGVFVASKIYIFSTKQFLDLVSIVLPLGQSIGRWGNYFNFELYGKPYNGIFKIFVPNAYRVAGLENISYYHPIFFYESFLNILLFALMFILWKKKIVKIGSMIYLYLYILGYGLIRYTLEPLRINAWEYKNINVATGISLMFIFIGIIGLIISSKNLRKVKR